MESPACPTLTPASPAPAAGRQKILALEQQRRAQLPGQRVGEQIAEVQRCRRLGAPLALGEHALAGQGGLIRESCRRLSGAPARPAAQGVGDRLVRRPGPRPRQILPARPAGALPFAARTDSQRGTSPLCIALRLTTHCRSGRNRAVPARRPLRPERVDMHEQPSRGETMAPEALAWWLDGARPVAVGGPEIGRLMHRCATLSHGLFGSSPLEAGLRLFSGRHGHERSVP